MNDIYAVLLAAGALAIALISVLEMILYRMVKALEARMDRQEGGNSPSDSPFKEYG